MSWSELPACLCLAAPVVMSIADMTVVLARLPSQVPAPQRVSLIQVSPRAWLREEGSVASFREGALCPAII